jgi:zinc/manganese transport system substrate-binding protein
MRRIKMFTRRITLSALVVGALCAAAPASAADKIKVVATFSILEDFVKNVGGDRVEIATLVGRGSDAHVYAPSPQDAKTLSEAKLVVSNGLGFEGWMARLVKASATKATLVVATKGVKSRRADDDHGHGRVDADPHAWQSVPNAKIFRPGT